MVEVLADKTGEVGDRRSEIVAAAIRTIEQNGLKGATMRAIAREMGLTTGVISHHFVDKQELLAAVVEDCFRPWLEHLQLAATLPTAFEELRALFRPSLSTKVAHVWLLMVLEFQDDSELSRSYRKRYGEVRSGLIEIFRRCQRDGSLRADLDPEMEVQRLSSMSDGMLISRIGEPDLFDVDFHERLVIGYLESLRVIPVAAS